MTDAGSPTPPARLRDAAAPHARRVLSAYSGEHAIYGIVLVTALIGVGGHAETDFEVILFVVGTVLVFWLAHVYAAVVASRAASPAPALGAAIRAGARHSSGMVIAMLIPVALLSLGTVGWVDEDDAYLLAFGSGIVLLGLIGYANAARNGSSWPMRIVGVLTTTAIGALVMLLSMLAH